MSTWKTVKIYICSNPEDMQAEREHLLKAVFPELREQLAPFRVEVVDVDPAWDFSPAALKDPRQLAQSLQLITKCQPFFIGLVGEATGAGLSSIPEVLLKRYGWMKDYEGRSNLEIQIMHGALNQTDQGGRAFFYFRNPEAVAGVPDEFRARHMETDAAKAATLKELKDRIRGSGHTVTESYNTQWDPSQKDRAHQSEGQFGGLEEFGHLVRDQLLAAIRKHLELGDQPTMPTETDHLASERHFQTKFLEPRLQTFVGRQEVVRYLMSFISEEDEMPCIVSGPLGSGKSAILAQALTEYRKEKPDGLALPSLVGVSSHSRRISEIFRTLCIGLKMKFDLAEDIPEDARSLQTLFKAWIRQVPKEAHVLIVIDGLNLLEEAHGALQLDWLPEEFAPNVKMVVSYDSDAATGKIVENILNQRMYISLEVPPFNDEEKQAVLGRFVTTNALQLNKQQAAMLMQNPSSGNPVFLQTAAHLLRSAQSPEEVNQVIRDFPTDENRGTTLLLDQLITKWEETFGSDLVQTILAGLVISRHGISEREAKLMTVELEGSENFSEALRTMQPYLHHEGEVISSYFPGFKEAIFDRYTGNEYAQSEWHKHLAGTLEGHGWMNPQTLQDLPWHCVEAKDWENAERILCDLTFIQAKVNGGMPYDLVTDYNHALTKWPDYEPYDPFATGAGGDGEWGGASFDVSEEAGEEDNEVNSVGVLAQLTKTGDRAQQTGGDEQANEQTEEQEEEKGEEEAEEGKKKKKGKKDKKGEPDPPSALQPKFDQANMIPNNHFGPDQGNSEVIRNMHQARKAAAEGREHYLQEENSAFKIQAYANFVSEFLEDLSENPEATIILARNQGSSGPVVEQAEGMADMMVGPWIARDPRPDSRPLQPLWLKTLEGHTGAISSVALNSMGTLAVSASEDYSLRIWDLASGMSLLIHQGHTGEVNSVALAEEAELAVSGSTDGTVRIWNFDSPQALHELEGHTGPVVAVDVSTKGTLVVSASLDNTLGIWNTETSEEAKMMNGFTSPATSVAMTGDGKVVLSGHEDGSILAWNPDEGKIIASLLKHEAKITSIAVTPDGLLAIAASEDCTLSIWDLSTGTLLQMCEGHAAPVTSVDITDDGRVAISGCDDDSIRIWDVSAGQMVRTLHGHIAPVTSVAIAQDSRIAVSASSDLDLRVWDVASGHEFNPLQDTWSSTPVSVSPGERTAVSALEDGILRFWDIGTGQTIRLLNGHTDEVRAILWTPDGRIVASASRDSSIRIWDLITGEASHTLESHTEAVNGLAITPDGKEAVSASSDGTLRVWNLATGAEMKVIEGHAGSIRSVTITPDGRSAVAGCDDNTLRVWDLRTGQNTSVLENHTLSVRAVAVSPDGQFAVSASWDKTVCAWNLTTGQCLASYPGRAFLETITEIKPEGSFGAGTNDGHMHFLALKNVNQEAPIVTPIRLFNFDFKSIQKKVVGMFKRVLPGKRRVDIQKASFEAGQKIGGRFDSAIIFKCPHCSSRSPVPDEAGRAISQNMNGVGSENSACLILPDELFQNEALSTNCPQCGKPVRLNPFHVDEK